MKYEILKDQFIEFSGKKLFRIRRIDTQTLGGYIESEKNLSQEGDAWVGGDAWVMDNARVEEK